MFRYWVGNSELKQRILNGSRYIYIYLRGGKPKEGMEQMKITESLHSDEFEDVEKELNIETQLNTESGIPFG